MITITATSLFARISTVFRIREPRRPASERHVPGIFKAGCGKVSMCAVPPCAWFCVAKMARISTRLLGLMIVLAAGLALSSVRRTAQSTSSCA